jgi:uncharacterized protein
MRVLLFALLLVSQTVRADFKVPALTGPVVDTAGMLRSSTKEQLSDFLRNLHDSGGAQIQVAAVPDLGGVSIEEASIKMTDAWKLGKKKEDRVIANRIIREVIAPKMRQDSPDRAVIDGVMAIAHYTDPNLVENAEQPRAQGSNPNNAFGDLNFWVWLIVFLLFGILPIFSRGWRRSVFSGLGWGGGFGGGGGWGGGFGGGGGGWSGGGGGFSGGGSSGSW